MAGNPLNVRVGPGILKVAPIGTPEPSDLATPWDNAWVDLGYTESGHTVEMSQAFENVFVAEEVDPIITLQTERITRVSLEAAEVTAANLQRALNGGTITTPAGLVIFEPPDVGDYTFIMLGWEADDGLERVVWRKVLSTGNASIARQKAPNKATIGMTFTLNKPVDEHGDAIPVFKHIFDADMIAAA